MEPRYSGAAGITADRVADKSFNNVKIRRAWMYNGPVTSLRLEFSSPTNNPSPSRSLSLLSLTHPIFVSFSFSVYVEASTEPAGLLERRPNTSIFHSGKMSADGNFLKMTRSRILPLVGGSWYCAYAESRRTIDSSLQTLKIPLARLAFHLSNRQIADVHANLATWRCLWAPLWPEIWQIIRYAYVQRESKVSAQLEGTTFIRKLFHMRAIRGPNWLSALFEIFEILVSIDTLLMQFRQFPLLFVLLDWPIRQISGSYVP